MPITFCRHPQQGADGIGYAAAPAYDATHVVFVNLEFQGDMVTVSLFPYFDQVRVVYQGFGDIFSKFFHILSLIEDLMPGFGVNRVGLPGFFSLSQQSFHLFTSLEPGEAVHQTTGFEQLGD